MSERTALYRLYDADGSLLYVGITTNPKTRFASHATYKPWWAQVARRDVVWLPGTWQEALKVEADAIRQERPKFNGKHNAEMVPFSADAWPTIDAPPRGKASAIADLVRAEIASGRWASGMRAPRREDVARASGVSESTVDLAYKYLQKEGLLLYQPGRGTIIAR